VTGTARRTLLLGGCAALILAGCGSGSGGARRAGLRVEREDLIAIARALAGVEGEVAREVSATRSAWPAVANGLPAGARRVPRAPIASATRSAAAIRVPAPLGQREVLGLTGPASGVAGLFRGFVTLSGRGWQMIGGALDAIERGSAADADFARANVALYIDSVYDAHFGLAQIGKRLEKAYAELGGPAAFGAALTQAEINRLADAYSEANDRLHPHPGVKLGS